MVDKEMKNDIIIKEILYWKNAKLIPEIYCDFLLALYTKGKGTPQIQQDTRFSINHWLTLIVLVIFMTIALSLAFFIQINLIIKTIIFLFLMIIGFILYKMLNKNIYIKNLSLILLLFIALVITIHLSKQFFAGQVITNIVIYLNFIGWFFIGVKNKLIYLKIVSILAILFMTIYMVL